jgi:hypothetical protein
MAEALKALQIKKMMLAGQLGAVKKQLQVCVWWWWWLSRHTHAHTYYVTQFNIVDNIVSNRETIAGRLCRTTRDRNGNNRQQHKESYVSFGVCVIVLFVLTIIIIIIINNHNNKFLLIVQPKQAARTIAIQQK